MGGYQIGLSASASSGASAGLGDIVFPAKDTGYVAWIVVGVVVIAGFFGFVILRRKKTT